MSTQSSWSLEFLIKAAFARAKDRFWQYILVETAMIAAFLGLFLLIVISFIPLFMTQNNNLITMLLIPGFFIAAGISFYCMSWFQLVLIDIMTNSAHHGVKQSFKEMKHHVVDFFKYNLLVAVFFIGLVPFGFMTFFALLLLWGFWSTFAGLVFLLQKKRGLDVLWTSRAMVNQKFWELAVRVAAMSAIIFMGSYILNSQENALFHVAFFIYNIFVPPFMLAFTYELYKQLEEPKEATPGTHWVILSALGWILIGTLIGSGITMLRNGSIKKWQKDFYKELQKEKVFTS